MAEILHLSDELLAPTGHINDQWLKLNKSFQAPQQTTCFIDDFNKLA